MRVLIETRMNSLRLAESKSTKKGCLGRLEGVCADFKNPTRNGRLYPLQLWEKVFEDALFKESLKNKTLFGELDHPEDRFEPLISEACVVMTDYRIDEKAGLIYGGFDILDTPKGRILKNIVDYGSVVGVSSRGQGDIVESADGEMVDEDSYEFACFDVVSTPAVEKARQVVKESIQKINKQEFTESVKQQIADADTIADLNIIRSVVRTSKLSASDIDSLIESIEDKCRKLQNGEETILPEEVATKDDLTESKVNSAKTIRDNKKLYKCIHGLKEKVSAYKYRESRYIETIQDKESEIDNLTRKVSMLNDRISNMNGKVQRLSATNESLRKDKRYVTESLNKSDRSLDSCENEIRALNEEMDRYAKQIKSISDERDRLSMQLKSANAQNNKLSEKCSMLSNQTTKLSNQNEKLNSQFEKLSEQMQSESAKLNNDLKKSDNSKKLLEDKLKQSADRVEYLENQIEMLSRSHQQDMDNMDSEVEDYTRLISEAQSKIDSNTNTIKELKESLSSAENSLKSSQSRNKQLLTGIKKFQECYLKRVSSAFGVSPDSLKQSISYDTTPQQIDSLVESLRDRLDRHNKAGFSKEFIDTSNDYVITTNRPESEENTEDSRLLNFLNATQGSL